MAADTGGGGTASAGGHASGAGEQLPAQKGAPRGGARAQHGRRGEAEELAALLATCARSDAIEHVLHLEAPAAPPLLHRIASVLVGAATVQAGVPPEVCLLVHPAHRRRGVGRRLLGRAAAACRRRGAAALLLTVDERSAGGKAFAAAVGGRYRFSEYRMELERVPEARPWPTPVRLRPATPADAAAFAHVGAAAFGEPDAVARARGVAAGMREPHHRYTLAELEGRPIGTIRVSTYTGTVYLTAFGVLPELQGQGFGRQILTRTVRGLAAEGRSPIRIEVATENRTALGLYRSCGFREIAGYAYYALDLIRPRPA
jgi:ribosomal protein S18 acetylase RimI-like enzyme